jgi:hypothetical protein
MQNLLYNLNALIPFNLIIDTEVGLIRLLRDKYNNNQLFYPGILDMPDKNLIYELHIRKNKNPISITITENCKNEMIESWYNELINLHYDEILERSIPTALYRFMNMCNNSNGVVKLNLLCNKQLEEQYIKKLDIPILPTIIVEDDYKKINLTGYDSIYIKNYSDILNFKEVQGKNLFIGNYKYNLEPNDKGIEVPNLAISALLAPYNKIAVIDVHPIDVTYIAAG